MKGSSNSPSMLKQKEVLKSKNMNYFCKKPMKPPPKRKTKPACKSKSLCSPHVLQEETINKTVIWKEHNTKKKRSVRCYRERLTQPTNLGIANQLGAEGNDNLGSDVLEKQVDFQKVKSYKDFIVEVHGLVLDSELPEQIRNKYYELCCSQKCYLHGNLHARLNLKFVAGMVIEIVNVGDKIKKAKFINSYEYLENIDTILRSFEGLGMRVGFMRERLKKLVSLSCEARNKMETKRVERLELEKEIRRIEVRVLEAERAIKGLDDERV